MMRAAILVCLFATACGGSSFIVIEASGDCAGSLCVIPDAVDRAVVRTFDADDLTAPILEESVELTSQTFPILISLEPGDGTPAMLAEQVEFFLDDASVGSAAVEHGWDEGKTNRVQIVVEVSAP